MMTTISSQSALWTVLALGLNTLLQPVDDALSSEGVYGRALRLSPIVCSAEVAFTLFAMSSFWLKTHSFAQTARLIARIRVLGDAQNRRTPAFVLVQRWWFRPLLLAFGVLPQAIKILFLRGAPLTQAWGAAYLTSFMIREAIFSVRLPDPGLDDEGGQSNEKHTPSQSAFKAMFSAGGFSGEEARILRQYEESRYPVVGRHLRSIVMFAQICFLIWELGAVLPDSIFSEGYSGTDHRYQNIRLTAVGKIIMVPLTVFATGLLAAGAAFVYVPIIWMSEGKPIYVRLRSMHTTFAADNFEGFLLALTVLLRIGLIIILFFAFVWYREYLDDHTDVCLRWAASVSILLITSVLFVIGFRFISGLGFIHLCLGLRTDEPTLVPCLFATASFTAILVYFIGLYDPIDTYKPQWTRFLG